MRTTIFLSNREGFTLLEVMVAFTILMFGMMALLSATTTAIDLNFDNLLKDEAVQIADEKMRVVKSNRAATFSVPFQGLSTVTTQNSRLRGKAVTYTTKLSSSTTGGSSNLLTVLVAWKFKGVAKQHEFVTMKTY